MPLVNSLDKEHPWRPAPVGREQGEKIRVPVKAFTVNGGYLTRNSLRIGLGSYNGLVNPFGNLE